MGDVVLGLLGNLLLAGASLLAMEGLAWLTHRYVMHGPGWRWHRSHHQPGGCALERNDWYAVVFAVPVVSLFALGAWWWRPLTWVAIGVTAYGVLYALAHDMLVHNRFGPRIVPRWGYLRRLVQGHRLHHAVTTRDGTVSFGFLITPSPAALARRLRALRER